MIINVRSPYFISVNEAGQIGSKLELRIWNGLATSPVNPTYTLSKSIASATQTENVYNISNFAKEYIQNIIPDYTAGETDNVNMWVNIEVKRFKETTLGNYTLIDTTDYIGVNGYTLYTDGYNYTSDSSIFNLLANTDHVIKYDITKDYPYINAFVNLDEDISLKVSYRDLRGRNLTEVNYTTVKGMLKIPVTLNNVKYQNGNTFEITYTIDSVDYSHIFTAEPVCEPKYSPVVCSFINRYGGWDFITFFKAKTDAINSKGTSYNVLQDSINYNIAIGQKKSFNINGNQTTKLNTGFVPENYNDKIQDLFLSETVLLNGLPCELKTQSTTLKTSLMDRNINYEMEFEYSYNLINDVI